MKEKKTEQALVKLTPEEFEYLSKLTDAKGLKKGKSAALQFILHQYMILNQL